MQELQSLWDTIYRELVTILKSETVATLWFGEASLEKLTEDTAVISYTSKFKKDIIQNRYMTILNEVFEKILGFPVKVVIHVIGEEEDSTKTEEKLSEPDFSNVREEAPKSIIAPPIVQGNEFTFENFVVGGSNKFAHAACTAVANNPAGEYNPLFIYGSSGLGKTHLLNAIMNRVQANNPNTVIIYVKGDEFTNQMIESIAAKTTEKFRAKYRKADVLLIDDIQFIAGRESTQEEFFHTFNALYEDHKQIIMTSDKPPRDIKTLEDRLRTRFEWGLIADIQPPDFELRIAIMRNKAQMMNITLPDEVLNFIAENLKSNIRQIEGAIKRIAAQSFLGGERITVEFAKKCIAALVVSSDPPEVTAKKVIETVSKKYGISVDDIYGKSRNKPVANARNVSVYIIRKVTQLSLKEIGHLYNRDHTTIISSLKTVENEIASNPLLEIEITEMIKEITE